MQPNQVLDLFNSRGRRFDSYRATFEEAGFRRLSMRSLLENLLERPDLLSSIAAQSYSHELSFDKIVLHRDTETGCVLRLHIWWIQATEQDVDVHNHGRDFFSRVILGSLRHSLWEVAEQGEEFQHYRYTIEDQSLESSSRFSGAAFLRRVAVKSNCEGESYYLPASQLHSLVPESTSTAATFVVQGPLVTTTSDFYKRPGTTSRRESAKASFHLDSLQQKLKDLLQLL